MTNATNSVSVAFANNPTGATLGGKLTVSASQGVATFSGLTSNKTGSGYTLKLSSTGLTGAVTTAVDVTKTGKSGGSSAAPAAITAPDPLRGNLGLPVQLCGTERRRADLCQPSR